MTDYVMNMAQNIKTLREHKELSQEKLAHMCGHTTDAARSWISKIEKGQRNIVLSELYNISVALNVEPGTLYIDVETADPRERYERLMAYNEKLKFLKANAASSAKTDGVRG